MEGLIIYINKNQVIYSSSSPYLISTFLVSELLTLLDPQPPPDESSLCNILNKPIHSVKMASNRILL